LLENTHSTAVRAAVSWIAVIPGVVHADVAIRALKAGDATASHSRPFSLSRDSPQAYHRGNAAHKDGQGASS